MDENIQEQEISVSEQESKAIEDYIKNIYSKKVFEPVPPEKSELTFWRLAGIEAFFYTLSAAGVIGFSSIRTGGFFLIVESLLLKEFNINPYVSGVLSFMTMVFSLMAFELYVAADGFSKGKDNKTVKRSTVGVWASLVVIVLGGVFSGTGLFPNLSQSLLTVFYGITTVLTAVAGGVIAYYSGENIGFTFSKVDRLREEKNDNHADKHQKWRIDAVKSYYTSHYNIRRSDGKSSKPQVSTEPIDAENFEQQPVNKNKKKSKVDIGYDFVKMFYKKSKRLPTNREIETATGIAVGTAFSALSLFIVENEEELVKKQMVSEKQLEKAKSHVGKSSEQPSPEPQTASYQHVVRNLIDIDKAFPTVESVMAETGLEYNSALKEMLIYVSENQQFLIENNILTEQQVGDAVGQLNQYPS